MSPVTEQVPADINAIDAIWLTDALRGDDSLPDDVTVTDVRTTQIAQDTGFSSLLYRLNLTGTGVPDSVIVTLAAQSEARGAMDMLGGYRRELAFYQKIAGRAPMATPHVYVAREVVELYNLVVWTSVISHSRKS